MYHELRKRGTRGYATNAPRRLCSVALRRICLIIPPSLRYLALRVRSGHEVANRCEASDYRRETIAKAGQEKAAGGLEGIAAMLPRGEGKGSGKGLPPVHLWNPPFCGDIDMKIAADGTWFYQKTPIGRPALVKLFASVLKREGDSYFLVTPVEKVGIVVEDAPFLAVEMSVTSAVGGRVLRFRTNVDDWVEAGPGHALRFIEDSANGGLQPMLHVRSDL